MTARSTITKKRFAPVQQVLHSSSSDISVLLSDSDEEIIQKQQDVCKTQGTVHGNKAVGHQLVSSTPRHEVSNFGTIVSSWPSPIVSQLSKQQGSWHKPNTGSKCSRKNESDNEESQGGQNIQKINPETNVNKPASVSSDEDGLVVIQTMGSGTAQKNCRADMRKKVLPSSKDSYNIISDSEDEIIEQERNNNNNTETQKTRSLEDLSPLKNKQQSAVKSDDVLIDTMTYFNKNVATSTPLRTGKCFVSSIYSLPSPIRPVMSPSGVVTRSRTGTSQTSLAGSGKMAVPAQKYSNHSAVISAVYKEVETKISSDDRKCGTYSREQCKDDEASNDEDAVVTISTEKQTELRSRISQNLHGGLSKRSNITTKDRIMCNSRKPSELRAKATEKKPASKPNNENKMTSRESFMKNQIVVSVEVHAQENAHNGKILSPNQGVKKNAQDIADNKNDIVSSDNDEIIRKKNRTTRNLQKKKASELEPNSISTEQKQSHVSAVPEEKTKRKSVSESEVDLRRSKRKRVRPLEYWRGERIQYKTGKDWCREVAGIDSGFPSRQWIGADKRPVHDEKKIFQLPQKNTKENCLRKLVLVPFGSGECELECFSALRVESDATECQEQNFTFFTGLEVPGMAAGYVEVAPFSETYSVIDSNLVFYILVGAPIVTVHETSRNMRKGEFFFVPRGVHYTVKNDTRRKAVLVFTKYN